MENKETLEEAMSKDGYHESDYDKIWRAGVQFGVKWQAERMYSEEEVRDLFKKYQYDLAQWVLRMEHDINGKPIPTEWFEQFKKK
jgi:hypothetical protein